MASIITNPQENKTHQMTQMEFQTVKCYEETFKVTSRDIATKNVTPFFSKKKKRKKKQQQFYSKTRPTSTLSSSRARLSFLCFFLCIFLTPTGRHTQKCVKINHKISFEEGNKSLSNKCGFFGSTNVFIQIYWGWTFFFDVELKALRISFAWRVYFTVKCKSVS